MHSGQSGYILLILEDKQLLFLVWFLDSVESSFPKDSENVPKGKVSNKKKKSMEFSITGRGGSTPFHTFF